MLNGNPGGWGEWSQFVLNELKRLAVCFEKLSEDMVDLKTNHLSQAARERAVLQQKLEALEQGVLGKYMPYFLLANIILWLISILAGMMNIKLPGAP